nr:meiotic recombination protein rec8 [Hymenolepis microstoma]
MPSQDIEIPVHDLENSFYLQARVEDITLIDASVTPRTHSSYAFGEDFQTEFLTELLGDKSQKAVPDLFQDESLRCNIDQIAEERENRPTVEQLLPLERPCEASIPRKRFENTVSIYDLDKVSENDHQKPSERSEVIREQGEQQTSETTALNLPEASTLVEAHAQTGSRTQLTESVKGPSTLDGVQWSELSTIPPLHEGSQIPGLIAEGPIVIDGPQIPKDTQAQQIQENPQVNEETLGAPSPKRRRLEGKDGTINTSSRNISFDLGNTQPCATSSAVRPRVLTPSPRLRIVPQSQLSIVQSQRPPPNRKRGKFHRLLIDEKRQLSKTEMLKNIQNSREILRTRAEYRAVGASLMHPRRARSRYPDRLLALPTNFELSISQTLSQMWRAKRQLCELGRLDGDLLPQKSQPLSMRHSKGNLWSIQESGLESSREMVRGGVSEISMDPFALRVSSLALQDQSAGEKYSSAVPSQSIAIPEEQIPQKPREVNVEAIVNPTEELLQRDNQPERSIPKVQIPEVVQLEERHPITVLPEAIRQDVRALHVKVTGKWRSPLQEDLLNPNERAVRNESQFKLLTGG